MDGKRFVPTRQVEPDPGARILDPSADASSRANRIAIVTEAAEAYFKGDKLAARRWLTKPNVVLGGASSLEFARTPEGSNYVIKLLNRMEHGVIS